MRIVLDQGGAALGTGFEIRVPRARPSGHDRTRTRTKGVSTMSIEEQGKGTAEEAKGRVEQAAGDLTGDNETKAHGMFDEAKGKLRQGVDKAREAIHDATAKH
jgi:uncharacterized protein YjbJ (UPF0337 family)